jgi:hypothetical protein
VLVRDPVTRRFRCKEATSFPNRGRPELAPRREILHSVTRLLDYPPTMRLTAAPAVLLRAGVGHPPLPLPAHDGGVAGAVFA